MQRRLKAITTNTGCFLRGSHFRAGDEQIKTGMNHTKGYVSTVAFRTKRRELKKYSGKVSWTGHLGPEGFQGKREIRGCCTTAKSQLHGKLGECLELKKSV